MLTIASHRGIGAISIGAAFSCDDYKQKYSYDIYDTCNNRPNVTECIGGSTCDDRAGYEDKKKNQTSKRQQKRKIFIVHIRPP